VANRRECLEQPDPVVELDRRAMEVVVRKQMMHANADLQNTFVQVADLAGRGAP